MFIASCERQGTYAPVMRPENGFDSGSRCHFSAHYPFIPYEFNINS